MWDQTIVDRLTQELVVRAASAERIDDLERSKLVASRNILRIQRMDTAFQACRDDQRIPVRHAVVHMKILSAREYVCRRKHHAEHIQKLSQAVPRIDRSEAPVVQLP